MQWVAVGIERYDLKPAFLKFCLERHLRGFVAQQVRHVAMWRRGPTTGIYLNSANTHALCMIQHLFAAHAAEAV